MNKWLIIAACLLIIGGAVFAITMGKLNWDFTKLGTFNYVTSTQEVDEKFDDIFINIDTADINFARSEDGRCKVAYKDKDSIDYVIEVKENTLEITLSDHSKWYDHIGFSFDSAEMTVFLPEEAYKSLVIKADTSCVNIPAQLSFSSIDVSLSTGNVHCFASANESIKIKTSTGDIYLEGLNAGAIDLTASTGDIKATRVTCHTSAKADVTTGDIKLSDMTCKSFSSVGTTGDITLNATLVAEKLYIERNTGDTLLNACDAGELYIKASTGDVKGTLLSEKIFFASSSTGKIDVPKSTTGGTCEINTSTGDIELSILK